MKGTLAPLHGRRFYIKMANELKTNDAALSLHSEKKMEETNKPIRKEIFLTNSESG